MRSGILWMNLIISDEPHYIDDWVDCWSQLDNLYNCKRLLNKTDHVSAIGKIYNKTVDKISI